MCGISSLYKKMTEVIIVASRGRLRARGRGGPRGEVLLLVSLL